MNSQKRTNPIPFDRKITKIRLDKNQNDPTWTRKTLSEFDRIRPPLTYTLQLFYLEYTVYKVMLLFQLPFTEPLSAKHEEKISTYVDVRKKLC